MRKFMKFLLVMMCMILTLSLGMSIKAEAANVTSGTLGTNGGISWTYDADTKTLTLTGEDSGLNGKWDSSKGKFKSLFEAICMDVEVIKVQNCTLKGSTKAMFANLGTLKSVEFSNVNTSGVTDMVEMFSGCSKLRSLDVSQFDTANVTNMKGMFYNCSSLSSLDVSKFNTSKVTNMSIMFYGCSSLSSLDVSKFNTSNVTDMSHMFYGCSKLSSLDVSKFSTSKVTNMTYMFSRCSSLSSLNVSNFITSKVTNMSSMFSLCSSLSSLDVSKFNTSKVTDMKFMFKDCSKLSSLDVSKFDTSKVINMSSMFTGCSNLSSLNVSNFKTSQVMDMSYMFQGCSSLSSLDVSGFDTSQVTTMRSMFSGCETLSSLDVSGFNTSKVTDMGFMFKKCSGLGSLDVSKFDTSKATDMDNMFAGCSNLSSLDVSNFNTSQVTDMSYMFQGCSSLSSLDVSGFDTSKVEDMSVMFNYCISLSSLDVSGFDTSNVISMAFMFSGCSSLNSLDVSGFDTSKVRAMGNMFRDCSKLSSLDVSGFDTSNVTSLYAMFYRCSNLNSLDLSKFNTSKVTNMDTMFTGCIRLSSLDVSGFDTSNVTSMYAMFCDCSSLSSLDLSGFDLTDVSGKSDFLSGCSKLVHIETPKTMPETMSIDLPTTYIDLKGEQTKQITKNFSNTTLINRGYLVSEIKLNSSSLTVDIGKTAQLTAIISPQKALNKSLTWKSSDTDVATVDANGKVTAVTLGTATITATAADVGGVSASCEVTVTQLVSEITLNKTSLSLKTGGSETFTATVAPSNASNKGLTWKSSDTEVATVDANGKVTAVAPGTAIITVTAKDGSGKSASCTVTVMQPVTEITLNKTSLSLKTGGSETFTVTVAPSNASNKGLTWKSSDTEVATVDANGKVTAVAPGTAIITVTAKDGSGKSASCTVTVKKENPFADVKETDWEYPFVEFVYDHNIMAGKGKTAEGKIIFDPDNYMTRAEFVQTLYNKEGKPAVNYKATFTDVPEGQWYTNAILWASQNGIAAGKGDKFDISGKITREEVATILYKYATNYKKYDTTGRASLDAYEDTERISSWAVNNMKWAIHYGIMKGRGNVLAPKDNASRAECATMLKNFIDAYK